MVRQFGRPALTRVLRYACAAAGVTDEALLAAHAAGGCSCNTAGKDGAEGVSCLPHWWMHSFGDLLSTHGRR